MSPPFRGHDVRHVLLAWVPSSSIYNISFSCGNRNIIPLFCIYFIDSTPCSDSSGAGGAVSPKTAGLLRVGAPPLFFYISAVSQRPHDEAENECSSSRGNGYGTLPPPGWQWKNCPSPVAPLEPKVFESMDQKRSLERSEGAHPQQSEETCFPPAIASKGLPKGAERSRQLGRVTRHRPPGPLRVQRLAADHCRKENLFSFGGQICTGQRKPRQLIGVLGAPDITGILRRQSLYSPKKRAVFPTKRIFCQNSRSSNIRFRKEGVKGFNRPTDRSSSKKEGPWFCPSLHDRSA